MTKNFYFTVLSISLIILIISISLQWYSIGSITGNSMSPTLNDGDLIIIKLFPREIKPGMIVAYDVDEDFAQGGTLTIHRVIKIEGSKIITKGDSDVVDKWDVFLSDIKGIYIFKIPFTGSFLFNIKNFIKLP